jgi:hypothetical protein
MSPSERLLAELATIRQAICLAASCLLALSILASVFLIAWFLRAIL